MSVGRRLEILRNVWRRLGNEIVSVRLKWSVKCRVTESGCQCWATLILGLMSVSDGKNGPVSGVGNTPFMGPKFRPMFVLGLRLKIFLEWPIKECRNKTFW